jgi:serine/threonine protein kinase
LYDTKGNQDIRTPHSSLTPKPVLDDRMVGRTISHYRITGQLGAGGMGVVYSAEDVRLGRSVALKFVSQDLADDQQAVQRLRSEARAASALNHPHICTIYDIGEDEGRPFIVMELMKGQTLRERLAGGPLKPHQILDVGIEVADALHVAHTSGIIHRDIKPGNIFITDGGHVKILDFGLAKVTPLQMGSLTTGHSPDATAAGVMLGTTAYMSPEQVAGEQLDGRSDLFSLGVVLYELATGHHPFPGKTAAAVVAAILDRAPAPALTRNSEIPVRLQEAIENCLEKDRELRYQSAADLRADLKRVRRDIESSHSQRNSTLTGDASSSRSGRSRSGRERSARPDAPVAEASAIFSRRPTLATGALVAVAVVAVAAFAAYRFSSSRAPEEPAEPEPPAVEAAVPTDPLADRLRLAEASLAARSYRAAAAQAAEILTLSPGHEGATKIRNAAEEMLSAFDAAVTDANRRIRSGDVAGAARSLETARGIDPNAPSLIALTSQLANLARRASATETRSEPAERSKPPDRAVPAPPLVAGNTVTTPQPPATSAAVPIETSKPVTTPVPPPPAAPQVARVPTPQPAPEPVKPEPPKPERATAELPKPPAPANDDAAIRQLVTNYARAIEAKDLALFRRIKPNLTREEERRLQEGFRAVTSQTVNLTIVSIERNGDNASVVVNRKDTVRAGGREYTTDSRQTLQLARTATGWGIVDIR